jgi:hypothetical protein
MREAWKLWRGRPATGALIPAVSTDERLPAATALHGMVRDRGQLLDPALAAGLLLVVAPEAVLGLNAVTFVVSALVPMRLRARIRPVSAEGKDAREAEAGGFRTVLGDARVRMLAVSSSLAALAPALSVAVPRSR